MDRRSVLKLGTSFSLALLLARRAASAAGAESLSKLPFGESTEFADDTVIAEARVLSKSPYRPPADTIPQSYKDLNYDKYRAIRFKKDLAIWRHDQLGFTAELFSTGFDAANRAAVAAVERDALTIVGFALHEDRKLVDKALKGLALHP